jgi:hypothetical protein
MNYRRIPVRAFLALAVLAGATAAPADEAAEKASLAKRLWPKARIVAALEAVEQQRAWGLLSREAHAKRLAMLEQRLAGTYVSQSLSVTNPPLNFIQNAGFEKINRNSAPNRSRWLWWGGWDWGGQYENRWEDRPEYVHSGDYSARIECVGNPGRIGIMTPDLPAVPGATGYKLTFWAKGQGDNRLFVNFESGARASLREQIPPEWTQFTLVGEPEEGADTYRVFFYSIGSDTIWLDDLKLVPVGAALED